MKIISDSKKKHWAIGRYVTCDKCESVYALEGLEDFSQLSDSSIKSRCPLCEYENRTVKISPPKFIDYPKWGTFPNDGTWKVVNTVTSSGTDVGDFDKLFDKVNGVLDKTFGR